MDIARILIELFSVIPCFSNNLRYFLQLGDASKPRMVGACSETIYPLEGFNVAKSHRKTEEILNKFFFINQISWLQTIKIMQSVTFSVNFYPVFAA